MRLGIQVDPLAAIMLVVVTVVSFLVQVYSRSYMIEHGHRDPGYSRFFAYLSLFTFSMLAVVLANNLLFLFIGWELVGLCSYLLIGFWYDRAARRGVHLLPPWVAAKKAFLTTRVGDVGLLIGLIILWNTGGTLQLSQLFDQVDAKTGPLFAPACSDSRCCSGRACACSRAPSARAASSRCTSGCPTPWKARRPSRR